MKKMMVLALVLLGCGNDAPDVDLELEQLPVASEAEGKADGLGQSGGYVWVRPDKTNINCFAMPCPERQVTGVNGGESKLVYKFDWRSLRLTKDLQDRAARSVGNLLLYGRFSSLSVQGQRMDVFQVTRAAEAASSRAGDAVRSDRYYAITGTVQCLVPPCALKAKLLGPTAKEEIWDALQADKLQLSSSGQGTLMGELSAGKGYVSLGEAAGKIPVLSQAFRPFGYNPLR